MAHKLEYSLSLSLKSHRREKLSERELINIACKNLFYGKITFLHSDSDKGREKSPTMGAHENTFLIRLYSLEILKDPQNSDKYLVRRLAAIEGFEMVSGDEKEESFVLEKDRCWAIAETQELKAKEAYDSRTFGPVSTADMIKWVHFENYSSKIFWAHHKVFLIRLLIDH